MIDSNLLILSVVASLCFGFIFGYIIRGFFRRNDQSEAQAEYDKALEAETAKKKTRNHHLLEVAQLWRDNRDRRLVFQVENKFYKRGIDLSTRDKELLLKVVMDFYHWLEPDRIRPRQQDKTSQSNQYQKTEASATPVQMVAQEEQSSSLKIDLSPVNILAKALKSDVRQSTLPTQSMVTQLDAILQEKLDLAGMKKWAIRLTEFPQRGMVVLVGLEQYDGIDEVPYERVRAIIRESVTEWEQRAEIGNIVQ